MYQCVAFSSPPENLFPVVSRGGENMRNYELCLVKWLTRITPESQRHLFQWYLKEPERVRPGVHEIRNKLLRQSLAPALFHFLAAARAVLREANHSGAAPITGFRVFTQQVGGNNGRDF